jgi:hypothetical protein
VRLQQDVCKWQARSTCATRRYRSSRGRRNRLCYSSQRRLLHTTAPSFSTRSSSTVASMQNHASFPVIQQQPFPVIQQQPYLGENVDKIMKEAPLPARCMTIPANKTSTHAVDIFISYRQIKRVHML